MTAFAALAAEGTVGLRGVGKNDVLDGLLHGYQAWRDLGGQVLGAHRVEGSSLNFVCVDGSVTEMDADGHWP